MLICFLCILHNWQLWSSHWCSWTGPFAIMAASWCCHRPGRVKVQPWFGRGHSLYILRSGSVPKNALPIFWFAVALGESDFLDVLSVFNTWSVTHVCSCVELRGTIVFRQDLYDVGMPTISAEPWKSIGNLTTMVCCSGFASTLFFQLVQTPQII